MSQPVIGRVIESKIFIIRGQRVLLSPDLAELYQVETRTLVQAVKRNAGRFPEDFMFPLSEAEARLLRSQFVILERGAYSKYAPLAFTEQGIAMLSGVLRSQVATQVNVEIMRAFVRLRQIVGTSAELLKKVEALERKYEGHDHQLQQVFHVLKELMSPKFAPPKRPIGIKGNKD